VTEITGIMTNVILYCVILSLCFQSILCQHHYVDIVDSIRYVLALLYWYVDLFAANVAPGYRCLPLFNPWE